MTTKFLRLADVIDRTGLGRSTIYKLMTEDDFPPNVSLGARAVAWVEQEIEDWIFSRIAQRDNQESKAA
ncbi:MAG: prophage regulatory protein [Oleispira sp.]|jgi:prophage regulatory protein